ncbi:putative WD repeat-containing protein all2124 [Ceratocystis lukuohia]|uniref:WD repeat-containing protein all2124 n=1 Tax=Ceratocystis lukuohia TaxID=2019550 RepID=A0ABR4ME05_9PEZI
MAPFNSSHAKSTAPVPFAAPDIASPGGTTSASATFSSSSSASTTANNSSEAFANPLSSEKTASAGATAPAMSSRTGRSRSRPRPLTMFTQGHNKPPPPSHPPVSMTSRPSRSMSFSLPQRLRSRSFVFSHKSSASNSKNDAATTTATANNMTTQPSIASGAAADTNTPIRPHRQSDAASSSTTTDVNQYTTAPSSPKARRQTESHIDNNPSSIRAAFHRASISFRGFMGFNSFLEAPAPSNPTTEPARLPIRPNTSSSGSTWHRLRQAASFRHSRPLMEHIHDDPLPSPTLPVPGTRSEPPIIPRKTGAAAKASVAMQNECLARGEDPIASVSPPQRPYNKFINRFNTSYSSGQGLTIFDYDRESGIGIMAAGESDVDDDGSIECHPPAKVDFIAELPVELVLEILGLLEVEDLDITSAVSRTWRIATQNRHVWRETFMRNASKTFASTGPVQPGTSRGIPYISPNTDWEKIAKARAQLDANWKAGAPNSTVVLNGHSDSIYCLQSDEDKIITGSRDRTIRVWDIRTYKCIMVIGPPAVLSGPGVHFNEDGEVAHFVNDIYDKSVIQSSMPNLVSYPIYHDASILCLQYDDDVLITGSSDSHCIVHDAKNNYQPIMRLQHHSSAVLDLTFDDKHIVTCSKDTTICVLDRKTGSLLHRLHGHTGPVNAVQMRGNSIVSCSGDFRVKLWNIQEGRCVREFKGHTKGLACSQFSEDGRFVASAGNDKIIRVWDANTGACLHEFPGHTSLVRSLHLDSVSGRLISGSYDADVRVFDVATGKQLFVFEGMHESWVLSTRSDYRRLITTSQDKKILIMDFGYNVPNIELLNSIPLKPWPV